MFPGNFISFLKTPKDRDNSSKSINRFVKILSTLKKEAVVHDKQNKAKTIWIHEQILKAQTLFIQSFEEMKNGQFYNGWCTLEQCELTLNFLRPHYGFSNEQQYCLNFIEKLVEQFQSLFPYKIFFSPEILEKEKKCTICEKMISIRNPCGHVVGEIYNGKMCCREITDMEFLGTSIVQSPLQKYSVGFTVDPKTGKSKDQYDYFQVQYVIDRLQSPFDGWEAIHTTKRHPHSNFPNIGRNSKCPCGSGKKYKNCCLPESGVLMPHIDIKFEVTPPPELLDTVYHYK